MDMSSIYAVLTTLQAELKAPKSQYNSFGKYYYRNCEDILTAVKPLLQKYGAGLYLTDSIEMIGDRYYVKAVATFTIGEEDIQNVAYAREDLDKKGMDGSQITGTASSYARKYALNGLFLIDDTKDADTDEYRFQTEQEQKQEQKQEKKTEKQERKQETCLCEKCGKVITAYNSGNGMVSVKRHAESSKEKFGYILCLDCIKEQQNAD